MSQKTEKTAAAASPQADGGAYEVLRARLLELCNKLRGATENLNAKRKDVFGGMDTVLGASARINTEHACVPRDIRHIGKKLVIGYDVFLGLKKETDIHDVLSVYNFTGTEFEPLGVDFLNEPRFIKDFKEIFQYYKGAKIWQVRNTGKHLLLVFKTGERATDIKVLRWVLEPNGALTYVDNRGERDHVFPPQHDFEWTRTSREMHVFGNHPHISIKDILFVECVAGDLTIKVENNTESGKGIFSDPVENPDQSLDDAEIYFAVLENLVLLKVRPFGEQKFRGLIFSRLMQRVRRIDTITECCIRLPEGHGVIFPGGYFLQTGECREFSENVEGMEFLKSFKSSNGEDILYVFYHRESGRYLLLQYNLVRKECNAPIHCHGFSLFPDGKLVVFKNAGNEPARSHAAQIWHTPFVKEGHEAPVQSSSYLSKIGNRDLVNGISDAFTIVKLAIDAPPSSAAYLDLVKQSGALTDRYHWLGHEECFGLGALARQIADAGNSIVDEFEKVVKIQQGTRLQIEKFATALEAYFQSLRTETPRGIDAYVGALAELRKRRGHLISLRELRYADLPRLEALEKKLADTSDGLSRKTVEFLLGPEALAPYSAKIDTLQANIEALAKVADSGPLGEELDTMGTGLDLLAEIINNLKIDDATARTAIVESLSGIYSLLNRAKAQLAAKRKELLGRESIAEFGAQFKLLGQGLANSISLCDVPEKCDDYLGKLLVHIEELEGRFGDFPEFIEKIAEKRDEIYNAFSTRKQSLLDERQRKAGALFSAADRILKGVQRRALTITSQDEMNGYFAADPMVLKIGETAAKLRELGDSVKADELQSRLKSSREEAMRTLRDKLEIFEDGANVIKFGKYRFSVNTEPLDVSLVLREEGMHFHITGSDYNQPVTDEAFLKSRAFWAQELVSENAEVYRGEYLAHRILSDTETGGANLSLQTLLEACGPGLEIESDESLSPCAALLELVRNYSANLYDEGYSRGIHDLDAAAILLALLRLRQRCGLLRFGSTPRAVATIFWQRFEDDKVRQLFTRKAQNLGRMRAAFNSQGASKEFIAQIADALKVYYQSHPVPFSSPPDYATAAAYLFQELSSDHARGFVCAQEAADFHKQFLLCLKDKGALSHFEADLKALQHDVSHAAEIVRVWLGQYLEESGLPQQHLLDEVLSLLLTQGKLERQTISAANTLTVRGLLGQHKRIEAQSLSIRLDEFLERLSLFSNETVPAFRHYQKSRKELLDRERARLKLDEFKPKTMSAFVRNKLINEVYLPLIGENFAKQLGETGANKRTDQMGLLLLISPPGYGKTTLMEYVASRLGLTFVKINGPALGTQVLSLDPAEAPNATAREEIEKLNLAFELGNNVMIYVDDIQHTNPEFLQKFISLCDAQRKIEGVYKGRTRTYDFRGKKVAVVMSGNPYTESGTRFQIPDMLANRADTYNLGDIIGGRSDLFELSYLENSMTSNPILRALASRGMDDFYKLHEMSRGGSVAETDLDHDYSAAELKDILDVLRKLKVAQDCVLKVNKEYIYSASQKDEFRTEPPFKLQGSYRNMNKISGKVLPVMSDTELRALIQDHYTGEAQALAGGAENNLLKLAETLGTMTEKERARYDEIKRSFKRHQVLGGAGSDDKAALVVAQMASLNENLESIRGVIAQAGERSSQNGSNEMKQALESLAQSMQKIQSAGSPPQTNGQQPSIEIVNTLPPHYTNILQQYQKTVEWLLIPILKSMQDQQKSGDDLRGQFDALNESLKKMIVDLGAQRRRSRKGTAEDTVEENDESAAKS